MNKFCYRKILVLWIAIGIGVSGYLYINRTKEPPTNTDRPLSKERFYAKKRAVINDKENIQYSILITVVGSILIGGFGYLKTK